MGSCSTQALALASSSSSLLKKDEALSEDVDNKDLELTHHLFHAEYDGHDARKHQPTLLISTAEHLMEHTKEARV
jgi:hypothetical protein